MGTLKPQNNGPLYSNTVIGTLAVDGWDGTGRAAAPLSPVLAVPNVTAHRSTVCAPTSYYSMWHYNCLFTVVKKLTIDSQRFRYYAFDVDNTRDTQDITSAPEISLPP